MIKTRPLPLLLTGLYCGNSSAVCVNNLLLSGNEQCAERFVTKYLAEIVPGPAEKADLRTPAESERGVDKKTPIVLVVEDEWLVRATIVDYLDANGCNVIEAASGEDAIALIDGNDQKLDVLFTDIRLGGALNGWDVAEIFRAHFPNIRVLYASGYSIHPSRDVPDSDFFDKPYRHEDILEACTRSLSMRPLRSGIKKRPIGDS
jgi:CheY-like chemotaxis protein